MKLTKEAQDMIAHFEALNIGGKQIRCPYFNNKKAGVRAALRVLVGKGSAKEIEEEARIISLRKHVDLDTMDEEAVRAFLIDQNLGIDCSALAYYVLQAEAKATGKPFSVKPLSSGLLRKLIASWRKVENVNVKTLAAEKNSVPISLSNVQPGDMVIMLGTGETHDLDHVLIVERIEEKTLHYVHSLWWKADGKYGGGIRHGKVEITHPQKPLPQQHWIEDGEDGEKNETLWRAQTAKVLSIRRLR